ncbi:MAG: sigma-54-dependent Fis family transcriptional regulator [Candidatus Latescibacteria bacterium]|nr:sigma-54-dependent Fis family transcriptional regulator [Candidatus Latescibacterota bacterium]
MSEDARPKVLIVDDVPANLNILRDALEKEAYRIFAATSGPGALRIAVANRPELILLDVVMPEMDGYEVCRRLKADEATRDIPVIFITARDEKESLLRGFKAGGVDYVVKPFAEEEVLVRARTHLELSRLNRELLRKNRELSAEIERRQQAEAARRQADEQLALISEQEAQRWGIEGFVGRSQVVQEILEEVRQVQSASNTSVFICGESGTGKELIARALHFGSPRAKGPFVPVNCAAIPHELAESALFGHVRGAFTGATADHKGYFELADGGTLFLDEIGDMPLELQAKLLRVLEEGRLQPVGSGQERAVDARVVAATNADLAQAIAQGRFRQDLYFRLARFTIDVPPLRQRPEDIPLLAMHFLDLYADEMGIAAPAFSPEALARLRAYSFPGNVRELKNIIEYALIKSGGATILPDHLRLLDLPLAPSARVSRAQLGAAETQTAGDEDRILAYVQQHGAITNAECRQLLAVDRRRATYLLDKMNAAGLLGAPGNRALVQLWQSWMMALRLCARDARLESFCKSEGRLPSGSRPTFSCVLKTVRAYLTRVIFLTWVEPPACKRYR